MTPLTSLILAAGALSGFSTSDQIAWGDYDGDGLADLLVVRPGTSLSLLRNQGEGTFADVTAAAGLGAIEAPGEGHWQDFDADGDPDLLVLAGGAIALLSNQAGTFIDDTPASGLAELAGASEAAWLDFDRDGLPDLQASTASGVVLFRGAGGGRFEPVDLGLDVRAPARVIESGGTAPLDPAQAPGPNAPAEGSPHRSTTRVAGPAGGGTAALPPAAGSSGEGLRSATGGSQQLAFCPAGLSDYNLGSCLYASAVPTLGLLYALSVDLNVDLAGNVGMGTTAPGTKLHVADASLALTGAQLGSSEDLVVESDDAWLGLVSSGFGSWGSGLTLKEVTGGSSADTWSILRSTSPTGSDLFFTYGGSDTAWNNTKHVVIQDDGDVGIGASSAEVRLHVEGGTDVAATGGGFLQAGSQSGQNLALDSNEIMARSNGTVARLSLNVEGGDVTVSGGSASGKLGVGTQSPSGRLHVVDTSGGDGSVVLPASSISASETAHEAGLAAQTASGWVSLSSSESTLLARTITAPASGYIIATASIDVESFAVASSAIFHLMESGAASGPSYSWTTPVINSTTLSFQRVFKVGPGSVTILLRGRELLGNVSSYDQLLTLLYVPTSYGAVTL